MNKYREEFEKDGGKIAKSTLGFGYNPSYVNWLESKLEQAEKEIRVYRETIKAWDNIYQVDILEQCEAEIKKLKQIEL